MARDINSPSGGKAASVFEGTTPAAWSESSTLGTVRFNAAVASVGGKVYVSHGDDGTTVLQSGLEYDPATDSLAGIADAPTARKQVGGVSDGTYLYAIGGRNGSNTEQTTVERYDPSGDSWTTLTPMSTARADPIVFSDGTSIWVAGGVDSGSSLSTVEKYDIGGDSWSTVTAMDTARHGSAVGIIDGVAYVGGGIIGISPTDVSSQYDLAGDSWSSISKMPETAGLGGGFAYNGELWSVSGTNGLGTFTPNVYIYDPQDDSWRADSTLPEPGNWQAVQAGSEAPVIVGGLTESDGDRSVYDFVGEQPIVTADGPGLFSVASRGDQSAVLKNNRTGVTGLNVFALDGDDVVATVPTEMTIYKVPK